MTPNDSPAPAAQSVQGPLSQQADASSVAGRPLILPMVLDIGLNIVIPMICYRLSKRYISPSEYTALLLATAYPVLKSIHDLIKRREIDVVSVVVLLGIAASIAGVAAGGSYKLLLLRESLFTFAFGVACLGSLLMPSRRPLMFFFGRVFATGNDPVRRAEFDAAWQYPQARRAHRMVTLVWGLLFICEFAFRVVLIYTVSPATVLLVSPLVLNTATILVIVWTFSYARGARRRGMAERRKAQLARQS
ncbi:MAG: hypothetical protein HIU85_20475 [Proteobacteria bacterium]|nr:hypothetical protein [Pseudomonadota bacterium]